MTKGVSSITDGNPVGEVLRRIRTGYSLDQSFVAFRSGLPQSQISRLESGSTRNPGILTVARHLQSLAVTEADFGRLMKHVFTSVPATPRAPMVGAETFEDASRKAANALDSSDLDTAMDAVRAMSELAKTAVQRAEAFNQAGGLSKVLGDAQGALHHYLQGLALAEGVDHELATKIQGNIANLYVTLGALGLAESAARPISTDSRVAGSRRGWAQMTLGQVAEIRGDLEVASVCYLEASREFQEDKAIKQAKKRDGQVRWAQVHVDRVAARAGKPGAVQRLARLAAEWRERDREVAYTAELALAEVNRDAAAATHVVQAAEAAHLGQLARDGRRVLFQLGAALTTLFVFATTALVDRHDTSSYWERHDTGASLTGGSVSRLDERHDT